MGIIQDRLAGLSSSVAVKGPCRVATTANVTLQGIQTIDGVTLATNDRVLVKDQTDARENGIYYADTGYWTRAKDFSRNDDVTVGTWVVTTGGSAPDMYQVADTVVFGETDIIFERANFGVMAPYEFIPGFPRPFIEKIQERVSIKDAGALGDNDHDDADAWDELQEYFSTGSRDGGEIILPIPDVRYKMSRTLKIEANNIRVRGDNKTAVILDFDTQVSGPGVAVGGAFDINLSGFSIMNAYGDCLELGGPNATGPQSSVANSEFRNLSLRGSKNGSGFYGKALFMATMTDIRCQLNAVNGFKTEGYSTTLGFERCWALANLSDGWSIKNATYSKLDTCGADQNGGFGYVLQDAYLVMLQCGAEDNDHSAFNLVYDHTNASGSLVPGLGVTVDGFLTLNNNTGNHSGEGDLVKLTSSSASIFAGAFKIDNWKHVGALNMSAHGDGSSNMRIIEGKMNQQALTFASGSGVFAHASDGATDYGKGLPINVSGANTVIGSLGPKFRNGSANYGGQVIIKASKDNRGAGGRVATYCYKLSKGAAGTDTFTLVWDAGNAAGANAADPGYTFNMSGNNIQATVAGSTALGNCYFHVTVEGDAVFTPA